jgi:hypothetical protein
LSTRWWQKCPIALVHLTNTSRLNKKGAAACQRNPLILLVGHEGFEPSPPDEEIPGRVSYFNDFGVLRRSHRVKMGQNGPLARHMNPGCHIG